MKTVTLKLPDSTDESDVKMQIAAQLFEKGIFSAGQAVGMAGISKREFIENVGKFGVSVFGETTEDIDKLIDE
jgi:predicted HTH domain antitoxin